MSATRTARALRRLTLAIALAAAATAPGSATASVVEQPGFQDTIAFSGLVEPTVVRFSADGRVFVAEKSGLVKVFDGLSDPTPTVFADLTRNVHNFWDRGLLGMTLAPNFPADPSVYVMYAYDAAIGGTAPRWGTGNVTDGCPTPPGPTADGCVISGRISKLTASGNQMTGTEQVLVNDWCQQYPSHSMGTLMFGADGALYASAGDGASFNFTDYGQDGAPVNPCGDPPGGVGAALTPPTAEGGALRAQDIRTAFDPVGLNGTVIRIDPETGAGKGDNPQGLSSDPNARRIIAHGLRNPFRFTIRPGTNEVWVADVGWSSWEEIHRIPAPTDGVIDNLGWPCREGVGNQPGYDSANLSICENLYSAGAGSTAAPYYTYSHSNKVVPNESCGTGSSAITGVSFFTGPNYPGYDGGLFFSDNSRACIWFMRRGANGLPDPSQIVTFISQAGGPIDLEMGPGGDLYYVNYDDGEIRRVRYTGSNQVPTADARANPESGGAPLTVQFDGTGSRDPEGGQLTYAWDLDDDGAYDDSTSATPTFTYTQGRTYTVRLRVTDAQGATGDDIVLVSVGDNSPPVPTIDSPTAATRWKAGDTLAFSGRATDPQDGQISPSGLSWKLVMHHCPSNCHTHPIQEFAGASGSFVAPDHEYPSYLELVLTATDSQGASASASLPLNPQTVDLTFASSAPGLQLVVGSTTGTAPFTRTVIVGSSNSVSAPSPQTLGGSRYSFAGWSDGGAATHNVVAPAAAATYTASFDEVRVPPVAAYAFDEGAGTRAGDASGNGNHGTLGSGAVWAAQGRFGGAISFDGVDDRVTVPDADSLDLTSGMTLEAWVKPTLADSAWHSVLFKNQPGNHVYALYSSTSSGAPAAEAYLGGRTRSAPGTAALPAGQWSHVASTYDGTTLKLYVNGTLAGSLPFEGSILTSTGELWIGGNPVWREWFNGAVDEVRVYDRTLGAAEITTDMSTRVGAPDTAAPSAPGGLTAQGGLGTIRLDWTASSDDVGVDRYSIHRGTSAGFTPNAGNRIAQTPATTYTDSGLAAGTYYYRVTASDGTGNTSDPSGEVSAAATADTTPPSVAVSDPAAGATVSGSVTLRATASDDDAVASVQFRVDGANVGDADTTAPYAADWDTRLGANGAHQITALAVDRSGNPRQSAAVEVTVSNSAAPPPTGLVGAFGFDEGTGAATADSSGLGNTGTLEGPAWAATGRFGRALSFDGVNDRVTVPDADALDLTGGMTMEAWVRPSALGGVWRTLGFKVNSAGDNLVYGAYANRNTNVPVAEGSIGGRVRSATGTAGLPVDAWSHLATTYDGTTLRLYVNGTQAASAAFSGTLTTSTGQLWIGGNPVWNEWFTGLVDELRIYNRALTAAELQLDMDRPVGPPDTQAPSPPSGLNATGGLGRVQLSWSASGDDVGVARYDVHRSTASGFVPSPATKVGQATGTTHTDAGMVAGTYHYRVVAVDAAGNASGPSGQATAVVTADTTAPDVAVTAPAAGATVSGSVSVTASASDDVGVAGVRFRVDGVDVASEDTSAPFSATWDTRSLANGAHDVTAVARDAAGNARTSAPVRVTVDNAAAPPPPGLVAAYGFNEGAGPAAADASGAGNGATVDGPTWSTAGRFGGALSFDGVNDRATVPDADSLDLTTGMTLEAWVNPSALGGVWRTVAFKLNSVGDGLVYGAYANRNTNVPAAEILLGTRTRTLNGAAGLPTGTWSHLATTYDGASLKLYVNGAQAATAALSGPIGTSTGALWIGGNPVWNEWFSGLLDDVRIYNRALTPVQIQADMGTGI